MCSHAYFTVLQTIFFSVCVSFNLPGSYLDQFGPDVLQIHYSVIHHSQLLSACSALIHFTVGLQFLESTLKELSASSGFVLATMYAMWSEVCGQTCLEQFFVCLVTVGSLFVYPQHHRLQASVMPTLWLKFSQF